MNHFDAIDMLADAARAGRLPGEMTAETIDVGRDRILEHLSKSVVFHQYIKHRQQGEVGLNNQNHLPWHAEGERQYAAFMLAMAGMPGGTKLFIGTDASDGNMQDMAFCVGAAWMLLGASVYLWNADIEDLADAAPLPEHVVSRDALPHPLMFWSRNVARVSEWLSGENNWLFVMHTRDGIREFGDFCIGRDDQRIYVGDIPYGDRYPNDFQEHALGGVTRTLARLAFLNSPYVAPEAGKLPRAWRREMARSGMTERAINPSINVVQLRRDVRENVERQRAEAAQSAERRSHWWVSGHHRAQWYPSKKAHEVIWIAPYLKGDLSKPLAQKVYAVVR